MKKPKQLDDKIFDDLFGRAEFHNLTAKEQETYLKNMMTEYDFRNCLEYSEEKGREEERYAIAKSLTTQGVAIDVISAATGLSPEQIKSLS